MEAHTDSHVPSGYIILQAPNGEKYLVPRFMVPVTEQAIATDKQRKDMAVDKAAGGPNRVTEVPFLQLAGGDVLLPADPVLSDREALTLHAEVKALQDRLGLSYKDAAHRLYMSEVEKLRTEKHAEESIKSIRTRIDHTIVEEIFAPITRLDNEDFEFSDVEMEVESHSPLDAAETRGPDD